MCSARIYQFKLEGLPSDHSYLFRHLERRSVPISMDYRVRYPTRKEIEVCLNSICFHFSFLHPHSIRHTLFAVLFAYIRLFTFNFVVSLFALAYNFPSPQSWIWIGKPMRKASIPTPSAMAWTLLVDPLQPPMNVPCARLPLTLL